MYHLQLIVILLLLQISYLCYGSEVKSCRFLEKKVYELDPKFRLNWYRAEYYCHSQKKNLATIMNNQENEEFKAYVRQIHPDIKYHLKGGIWIGGTDLGDNNTWRWFDTGELITYFNWNVGEPNRVEDREHCLEPAGWDLRWNDNNCLYIRPFVCEHTVKEPICSPVND